MGNVKRNDLLAPTTIYQGLYDLSNKIEVASCQYAPKKQSGYLEELFKIPTSIF